MIKMKTKIEEREVEDMKLPPLVSEQRRTPLLR